MALRSDLAFDLGETWTLQVTCHSDAAGTVPMDLTGATVTMSVGQPGGGALLTVTGATQGPATNGVSLITVSPSQQHGVITPGGYGYTVRVTRGDGTVSDQLFGLISVRGNEFPAP